jgi:hypothetical protein
LWNDLRALVGRSWWIRVFGGGALIGLFAAIYRIVRTRWENDSKGRKEETQRHREH